MCVAGAVGAVEREEGVGYEEIEGEGYDAGEEEDLRERGRVSEAWVCPGEIICTFTTSPKPIFADQ